MRANWMSAVVLGGLAAACGAVNDVQDAAARKHEPRSTAMDDEDGEDDDEQPIALDQVPAAVKKAAEAAVPGLVLKKAETETEEGALHYCLEGTADGEAVEVEVSTDGKVLEVERGEEEDDDD